MDARGLYDDGMACLDTGRKQQPHTTCSLVSRGSRSDRAHEDARRACLNFLREELMMTSPEQAREAEEHVEHDPWIQRLRRTHAHSKELGLLGENRRGESRESHTGGREDGHRGGTDEVHHRDEVATGRAAAHRPRRPHQQRRAGGEPPALTGGESTCTLTYAESIEELSLPICYEISRAENLAPFSYFLRIS